MKRNGYLLCMWFMAISCVIAPMLLHARSSHHHNALPQKKVLEQRLHDNLYTATRTIENAMYTISQKMSRAKGSADSFAGTLHRLYEDHVTIRTYMEQLLSGEPPLARRDIDARNKQVEQIIHTWNTVTME